MNSELGKLRTQKAKETPKDERQKKTAARCLLKEKQDIPNINPIDTDNEETEVDKEEKGIKRLRPRDRHRP